MDSNATQELAAIKLAAAQRYQALGVPGDIASLAFDRYLDKLAAADARQAAPSPRMQKVASVILQKVAENRSRRR